MVDAKVKVKILDQSGTFVILKLFPSEREVKVPTRVFERRVALGFYEVENISELPTVI